jgi:uncharacterized membrane protein YfcA
VSGDPSLLLGGVVVAAAALLSGTSGFGFALVATPMLLLSGFSLPFVVTANLLVTVATRVSVALRLRRAVSRRRAAILVGSAIPGLWIGAALLRAVDEHTLRLVAGLAVAAAAAGLAWADRHPPRREGRGAAVAAGSLGGVLATTTSLVGIPPALLLARQRVPTATFFADLSVYLVATAAAGLAVLGAHGEVDGDAARAFVWWLPGVLVANAIGTAAGLRAHPAAIRRLTLGVAFVAGVVSASTA